MDSKFKPAPRNNFGQSNGFQSQQSFQTRQTPREDSNPFQNQGMYQEQPTPPPMMNSKRRNSNGGSNKKLIAIIAVVVLLVVCAIVYFISNNNQPSVENVFSDTNVLTTDGTSMNTVNTALTGADGNPVQVKWPSDITPTKMELHLDPVTGSPILMLVGEKSGLGTVVRSHDANGNLTGFWVIVTDTPALENYSTGTTNSTPSTGTQVTTPNLEQTIADEIHVFIKGEIKGKTTETLLTEHKDNLSAVSKKYGKTNEEVLGYYLTILSAQGVTQ